MTFRYALVVPAEGPNKLLRFKQWAGAALPDLQFSLPPQVSVRAEQMSVRLRSPEDAQRLAAAFPATLP